MAAALTFYIDNGGAGDFDIATGGSGLGFYGGGGFDYSVSVAAYQENTYVTDSDGVTEGPQANNVKYLDSGSGEIPVGVQLPVIRIPNAKCTLNPRFTNDSAVQIQNAELRIYDRASINNPASGVTTRAYECLHPDTSTSVDGSGLTTWTTPAGSGTILSLADSPGVSGLAAGNGSSSTASDTRHDWYVCLSARPDSIGSKTQYGLYVSLEYL